MRIFLFLSILFFQVTWANPCNLSFKQVKEAALVEKQIALNNIHHSFDNLKPYEYELELANQTGLNIEEVMGLTRNFHDDLVTTGDTGIYRMGAELKYLPNNNLMKAYKWGMENINIGSITKDDLINLRKNALEFQYYHKGETKKITDFAFKSNTDVAYIKDELHPEILADLKKYGHRVEHYTKDNLPQDLPDFVKLSDDSTGLYIIRYPQSVKLEQELNKLSDKINKLVAARAPPEYVASVAVQDLLTLHPFADGNGRTARLYGQILYKKLTGKTIIFPEIFHKEMSYSATELASSLFKNADELKDPTQIGYGVVKNDELLKYVVGANKAKLEFLGEEKVLQKLDDLEFDEIILPTGSVQNPKITMKYADLPDTAKLKNYDGDLYFGKGFKTQPEAEGHIKSFFSKGRQRQTLENVDLEQHVRSTRTYQSSFVQTTTLPKVADDFAYNNFGVTYIIDPKDASLLDVNEAYKAVGHSNNLSAEKEILFLGNLNPERIKGAYIKDRNDNIVKFYLNPFYKPR